MNYELASELAHSLYNLILKRESDPEGLNGCISQLQTGIKYSDLIEQFKNSEEYKKNRPFIPEEHPLRNNPELYTPELSPYYTFRGLFRPLALHIETINICNNDCIFCPPQTIKPHIMSIKTVENIIRQYEEIGGGEIGITPTKGEAFLDKGLLEKLRVVRSSPLVSGIYLTSNAAVLGNFSDASLTEVLRHLSGIAISVYGLDEEEHFSITKRNDYKQILICIARLLRLGNPQTIALHPRSLKKRDQCFLETWHSQVAILSGVNKDEIRFSKGTLNYFNWGALDDSCPLPHDAVWCKKKPITGNCFLPLLGPQISSDGNVSFCPCVDVSRQLFVGNIHDTSIKNIYESDKYKEFWHWEKFGIPTFCQGCTAYHPLRAYNGNIGFMKSPVKTAYGA